MEKDKVKELDNLCIKLGIPQGLLRVIVAYAIVYTRMYDMFTPKEMIYELSKDSINKVDINYAKTISKSDGLIRKYGRDLVEEVAKEKGIYKTK